MNKSNVQKIYIADGKVFKAEYLDEITKNLLQENYKRDLQNRALREAQAPRIKFEWQREKAAILNQLEFPARQIQSIVLSVRDMSVADQWGLSFTY